MALANANKRSAALAMFLSLVVFAIAAAPTAHAQTFTVLHQFSGSDGYQPYGTLLRDNAGNLYGTTYLSLTGNDSGTVFRLKNFHGGWLMSTLYNFTVPYAAGPYSGVVFGPGGGIFGTTLGGGTSGHGSVYAVLPPSNPCRAISCPWTSTDIHSFTGGNDGAEPWLGSLIYDNAGNLYGTTAGGGAANAGTVFKVARIDGVWTETVIYSFAGGNDGAGPENGVTLDVAGNLYGTTGGGGGTGCGGRGCGTVYKLTPSGSGWTESVLYRFTGLADGYDPFAGVILDGSGNIFGTTITGGANDGGTVFELTPNGGGWNFNLLAALPYACCDGGSGGNLVLGPNGVLYGSNIGGGNGLGQVFKLTQQDGTWTYTVLHQFTGPEGQWPYGAVILDSEGNLYGTASEGGVNECDFEIGCGTVWEITP